MHFSASVFVAGLAAVQVAAKPCPKPEKPIKNIQLGPRPYYLVDDLEAGPLKTKLESCTELVQKPSTFSVAHRGGGTLQIPEHSRESNLAGARMGAGILECDTAFTSDRELVCRHSQCDLHYTTNILAIPELADKCTTPFTPANGSSPATAKCCTSDITLAEFKTLCAKMEGQDTTATTVEDYLAGTPSWRTSLYDSCAKVLSLKEHIALTESLGLQHTPELKTPEVEMPFEGDYTQEQYAQQLVDTYRDAGVPASRVWMQSFLYDDLKYWVENEPEYAARAMYLDPVETAEGLPAAIEFLDTVKADGVNYIAPPLPVLVQAQNGTIVPSAYARRVNELNLGIVTWSLERSAPISQLTATDFYYFSIMDAIKKDGDIYKLVDVLYQQIGVVGIFSDWSATVTYYANCFGIGL